MGEIILSEKNGKRKPHNRSTRVDLTPMVDLGFLLITFFIFTTSMSHPKAMKLNLPDERPVPIKTSEEKTINIIIEEGNQILYYPGKSVELVQKLSSSTPQIREIIIQKKKDIALRFGDARELVILIKPTMKASYKDVVKILDEMIINGITRYVLMEPAPHEKQIIAAR